MKPQDRYDSLIEFYAEKHGLGQHVHWLKNQMLAESGGNPKAVSPVGAKGLFQFMPDTWKEYDDFDNIPALDDPFNPEENIEAACKYMAHLYSKFSEIPEGTERLIFAAAAYNCGRGNVNKMLELARHADGKPANYKRWVDAGKPGGVWQMWGFASQFLEQVTGKRNAKETLGYIERIFGG